MLLYGDFAFLVEGHCKYRMKESILLDTVLHCCHDTRSQSFLTGYKINTGSILQANMLGSCAG